MRGLRLARSVIFFTKRHQSGAPPPSPVTAKHAQPVEYYLDHLTYDPNVPFGPMVCKQINALLDDSILKGTMTYEKDFEQMVKYYFDGEGKAVRPLLVHKMADLVNFHLNVDKVKHQVGF